MEEGIVVVNRRMIHNFVHGDSKLSVRPSSDKPRMRMANWVAVGAASVLLGGCATLPPILERWADLEITTQALYREDCSV